MSIVRDLTFFRVDGFSFILSEGLAGTVLLSEKFDTVQDIFQTILDIRHSTFDILRCFVYGLFQPFPFNSFGGRPRGAASFVRKTI